MQSRGSEPEVPGGAKRLQRGNGFEMKEKLLYFSK